MSEMDSRIILGASLGEQPGETGIAILSRVVQPVGAPEVFVSRLFNRGDRRKNRPATKDEIGAQQALEYIYNLRHLERPKGDLVDVLGRIVELLVSVRDEGGELICILDSTGTGYPAFAYLVGEISELGLDPPMRVSAREMIVSNALGGAGQNADGAIVAPRRDLITAGRLTMASKKLRVAPKLKLADALREELGSFSRKPQRTDIADPWRLGSNDDLVLATVCGLYASERFLHTPRAINLEGGG